MSIEYVQDHEADRIVALSHEAIELYNKYTGKIIEDGYYLHRDDPIFVKVVKELGSEKASGEGSLLKILTVPDNYFGIVYSMFIKGIRLTEEAKKLYKELSNNDFDPNIDRSDHNLVKVVQKLGDRSVLYPMDVIEIEYLPIELKDYYDIKVYDNYEMIDIKIDNYKLDYIKEICGIDYMIAYDKIKKITEIINKNFEII